MLGFLHQNLLFGDNRRNFYASLIVLLTFGFFHWNTDPEVCGGDPIAQVVSRSQTLIPAAQNPDPKTQTSPEESTTPSTPLAEATPGSGEATAGGDSAGQVRSPEGTVLTGRWALTASQERLLRGREFLESIPDYSAQFRRHERINGELLDPQVMNLKVRHEPFSLYMKWVEGDKGRQLIFVKGQNDDKVLVQIGGLAGRLTGALAMAPDDPRVLAESRYPATCAGILELTKIILNHHENDLKRTTGLTCEMRDGESFDNRPCFLTTLAYDSPASNPHYYKSLILIDKELSVPVSVRNYTWVEGQAPAEENEESLIESYSFTGVQIDTKLTSNDFEKGKYKMR